MKNKESQKAFLLKEKNPFPSYKICEGVCSGKKNYIGGTKRSVITCWNKHENPNKDLELAKHLFQHPYHNFQLKVMMSAPMNNPGGILHSSETSNLK